MTFKLMTATWLMCCFGSLAFTQQPKQLTAPTYYIAIAAQHSYDNVIRVRGASNLPPGTKILLQFAGPTDQAWKEPGPRACVALDRRGLFGWQEISIPSGEPYPHNLFVSAIFLPDECKQSTQVLKVLGTHGEYLGHDNRPVTMDEVSMGMTPGMQANPQLFQVSGWYFGISTITPVE
jgi:hypothetical protein